jgi:thermostable 8-oxoguanine DNA glycosylase
MRDPREQYEQNRTVYDNISEQVEQTTSHFAAASRTEQKLLLNRAVAFALISSQTAVEQHEKGYLNALEASDFTELEQGLLDAGVNYYRNKAKYLFYNMTEPDYERVLDLYDAGEMDKMHRAIADEFKGVSTRKAAFAMAKVVTTDKMCLDTNVCQRAGIEPDEIYNGVVVDTYEQQCQSIKDQWPDLHDELGAFMFQWVLFDSNRETVTCHDAWFMSLPEQVGVALGRA